MKRSTFGLWIAVVLTDGSRPIGLALSLLRATTVALRKTSRILHTTSIVQAFISNKMVRQEGIVYVVLFPQ